MKTKISFILLGLLSAYNSIGQPNIEITTPANCESGFCQVDFPNNPIEAGLSNLTTLTITRTAGPGGNVTGSLNIISTNGGLCSSCSYYSIEGGISTFNIDDGVPLNLEVRFSPPLDGSVGNVPVNLRITVDNDDVTLDPPYIDADPGTPELDIDVRIFGSVKKTVIKSSLVLDRVGSVPAQYGLFTSETLPILLDTAHEAAQDVTHFYIHEVFGGELYLSDGTTLVSAGDFISQMEGKDGVKFLPTTTGSTYITVRAAYSNSLDAIAGAKVKFLYTVAKTPLVVTAGDLTRTFEEENQQPIISYSGFVFNEDSTVLDRLPNAYIVADQCSDPGSYPIVVSGGYDDHYDLQVVNGILTIDEAEIDEEDNVVLGKENIQGRNATSIKIYPNPSNSTMRLDFIGFEKRKYVTILTNDGAIFKKFSIDQDSYTLDFGTSGLYMIKVEDSKGMIVEKVIVHK